MRAAAQRRAKPIETVPTLQISDFYRPTINCNTYTFLKFLARIRTGLQEPVEGEGHIPSLYPAQFVAWLIA